jgi:palmitoyl transferase
MMHVLRNTALCFIVFVLLAARCLTAPAYGAEGNNDSFFGAVGDSISNAWNKGTFDFYLPAYTWHNRFMYDRKKAQKYNEIPWGAGIGKSYFDSKGNHHALLAVSFTDSNNHFEPLVGYAYIWYWELFKDFSVGAGIGAGVSARYEYNYIPFPGAMPLVSLQYKSLAALASYVPGKYNRANVLLVLLRWHFD